MNKLNEINGYLYNKTIKITMEHIFRVFDFNVYNNEKEFSNSDSGSDNGHKIKTDNSEFVIQMFGLNEKGETCSIQVEDFKPFFYVMVNDNWNMMTKNKFLSFIKNKIGKYYENSITEFLIIKRKKLYGFDGGKEHKFIKFEFKNMAAYNKVKNLWYTDYNKGHKLFKNGLCFENTNIKLYEANIPPLLRLFHIRDISPSGWIALPIKKTIQLTDNKKTSCDYEFIINYKNIIALNDKETRVPYKIMSFDIEASSSHGDFPVPIKSYKKLATNIIEYFETLKMDINKELCKNILRRIILTAFGYETMANIDLVYPKNVPKTKADVVEMCEKWLESDIRTTSKITNSSSNRETVTIEEMFEKMHHDEGDDEYEHFNKKHIKQYTDVKATVVDILCDKNFERDGKLFELNNSLNTYFPKLEGDKVTFIGSTFMNYGDQEPYKNHCIVLNTCSDMPIQNSIIESYQTERDVLLAWQQLVQKENPDIVIGYNIFGFDYEFMFRRAEETGCVNEFLKLSRNMNEMCATKDKDTNRLKIEESTIQIASGQHDLKFIKMNGRLQVDLYNFFRREENLTSYKLDYVAGHFIGDYVKNLEHCGFKTEIKTTNLTGLLEGSYIHLEEIGHSVDYYDDGAKFKVVSINKEESKFKIDGIVNPDMKKKVRWCLAKDDVTPKDIFRMTNGSADDRSVIAKYCIQDCNLVHYLFNKADVLTGFIEMAKICSVPINFLVMRGQGIKLTSYVAKKCREKRTLIPVIEKGDLDEGYEGAIVLDPKCDLYLDNPVACVDYASLYPSSMISENLSHDSKVWTREYDLAGNLIEEWGEKDDNGNFMYDNLPGYEYVNITYDTFKYVRKTPKAAAEKIKSGTKICRFAQFPEGKAIMPSILEELLMARKSTRKLIPQQTDDFMKNVLDKRQLGYKVTANSLYGQCGAKTSTFYEKDIAACTTATGRLLLTYAKKIIEECYGDAICQTSYGVVVTRAEYIYGDTDSVFFTFNLQTPEGKPIRGKEALEITIELAQEAGHLASSLLKAPHDLEYEKTFMPFCLLSKKRYVGMLYETDPNKCKRKEMGIVLKRRDNAPIVKDIYGGIIDILMKEQNINRAIEFLQGSLQNIVDEKYPMEKLIITKSLRSGYKNPQSIAHKVLADRITARDPGNKPGPGDRIPFVYINTTNKKALQGDKIETPTYIKEQGLKIDYSFYITNQIMKPVQQVFALVLEKIWELQNKKLTKLSSYKREVESIKKKYIDDLDKCESKIEDLRNKEIKALLFDRYLRETNNEKQGVTSITNFFALKIK
jgi:DNA polymerase elongation subunit (family B)